MNNKNNLLNWELPKGSLQEATLAAFQKSGLPYISIVRSYTLFLMISKYNRCSYEPRKMAR